MADGLSVDGRKIENGRPAEKEAGGAAHGFVELGEPVSDRRLGCEHEGEIGAAAETHGRA